MDSDAELVARIRQGDLGSFEVLYDRYKVPVFRAALALTRDHPAAEELLQDTFVRAYLALGSLDLSVPVSPWLHRIVVNLSFNWNRRHRQWPVALYDVLEGLNAGLAVHPEAVAEASELSQIIQEAIVALSFKRRLVVVLYYLQGLSLQEIAYVLDCPVGTVKSRLHYTRQTLRIRLARDRRLSETVAATSL